MRTFFLFLSRQKHLRKWMETSGWARRFSARFVAGDNLPDALATCQRINAEGIAVTLDHLGENVTSLEEAAASRDAYMRALCEIGKLNINGNVSLKLTQFGMDLSLDACRANVEALVRQAAAQGNFVRVDMESSEYTSRTLDLVVGLHERYQATGTVIQAYLHRSRQDVEMLCARGIRVRLCKGAYLEPPAAAFQNKADVDRNFIDLANLLLESGVYPAIATHDEKIIEQTKRFVESRKIARDSFEFQMLYGIRRDIQKRLVNEGYRLRLYVPYGQAWYPYFMRRLAERPANVLFLARNLLRN
ncbi:MAG TPA: proline dehydrogenase family protein [Bryobacteraceae bacterium]|jgi:proline dehydrogenase|nr:proline dehydrogenase family protein [Bryobacteraceae bacterium]